MLPAMLPNGADGLFLPIACALVAALLFGAMVRRHPKAAASSEAAKSNPGLTSSLGSASGRDPNLPRWLDPSIAAARLRTDTTTAVRAAAAMAVLPPRAPIVFNGPIDDLTERVLVRYDGVPLLDRPDDVLGQTQGELDGGDEAEILERGDIWTRVRTPEGGAGWIPSMTISALVTETTDDAPEAEAAPEPEPPTPADAPPALESILEAIAARRLAAGANDHPAPAPPKRPRSRKPKSDGPSPRRR
jgi:hypothetical protein